MLEWIPLFTVIVVFVLTLNQLFVTITLVILRNIISALSSKIKNQAVLQELLKKEGEILGLSGKNIKIALVAPRPYFEASAERLANGSYLILCTLGSSKTVVAHELFHIYDGSADKFQISMWIKYLYWWEPRAIFYEFKRLRALNR